MVQQRYTKAEHDEEDIPDIDLHRGVEGEAEAKSAQIRVLVIADPKQDPSKQEEQGQNWQGPGFLRRRIE